MTPRPIHRWKSFWLGLFVAGFFAWAWWDSTRVWTVLAWHDAGSWLWSGGGKLGVAWWRHPPMDGLSFEMSRHSYDPVLFGTLPVEAPDYLCLEIRHAAFLITWLILWSGWLAWHGRRERRQHLTEPNAAP